MNLRNFHILGLFAVTAAGALLLVPTEARAQAATGEDVQVLTRGPVHEAFAESVSLDPVEGIVVTATPPELIEELPPNHELEGDNVTWISGYWAWDDERNDFIWISGIWRNVPPDRQWVPGYWNDIGDRQYQWTSGYWANAEVEEVAYVSTAPPRSLEVGPNIPAPSADHSWVPGNWMYADSRYNWRPGYWVTYRPNWTWVPARYCWTRHGYVYVDGYWDYAVARRGMLFAPVYYNRRIYTTPDYYYMPSIVVALSVFADHLFIRPRHCHYYFGDYYAPRYRNSGFHASHSWHSSRGGYDPIYAYQRWDHRRDSGWEDRRQRDYEYFRDNEDARPPGTWAAMRDYRDDRFDDRRNRRFADSIESVVAKPMEGQRFRALDEKRRENYVSQAREIRKFSGERRKLETQSVASGDRTTAENVPNREKFARSPVIGRSADRFAKDEAPPARPVFSIPSRDKGAEKREDRRGEATPQRQPEGASDRKIEPTPQRRPDATPQRKTDPTPQRRPEAAPQRKTDPTPQRRPEAAPQRRTDPTPQRRPEAAPQRKTDPTPQRRPEAAPQRRTDPTPQRRPDAAPQRKTDPTPQRRPEAAPQRKTDPTPQRRPEAAPQRKTDPTPQRRPDATPQRKTDPTPQRRPEAAPQRRTEEVPKTATRTEPQSRKSTEREDKKNK